MWNLTTFSLLQNRGIWCVVFASLMKVSKYSSLFYTRNEFQSEWGKIIPQLSKSEKIGQQNLQSLSENGIWKIMNDFTMKKQMSFPSLILEFDDTPCIHNLMKRGEKLPLFPSSIYRKRTMYWTHWKHEPSWFTSDWIPSKASLAMKSWVLCTLSQEFISRLKLWKKLG